jgi:hypothetical protein
LAAATRVAIRDGVGTGTQLPLKIIDEGENFRLAVWQGAAYCQVWRRPDVSAADGTRFAAVLMNSLRFLLTDDDNRVPGIVFDIREAPLAGPNTYALLSEAVNTWSLAGKSVVMLVGTEEQRAQMTKLVAASGNGRAVVCTDPDEALRYAANQAAR